ncbi:MAG: DUF2605 domain-containing protein [Chroococcus sp. CMT-3BRIN-NPC107]|jgi:hypothetical protein|nr:DUF2605 domain-containing protein [Chroococcus sp. CMT-3BRIN-NPC107]
MLNSNLPESELLKTVLKPLLQDFQYWFGRSLALLETESIDFLTSKEQLDLLERVKQAKQEVSVAQIMFEATGEQVGIEMSALMPWHQLVTECWKVAMRLRLQHPTNWDENEKPK